MTIFYNYTTFGFETKRLSNIIAIVQHNDVLNCYKEGGEIVETIELNRLMFFDLEPKRGDNLG